MIENKTRKLPDSGNKKTRLKPDKKFLTKAFFCQ